MILGECVLGRRNKKCKGYGAGIHGMFGEQRGGQGGEW